jgi:hypothetical protein
VSRKGSKTSIGDGLGSRRTVKPKGKKSTICGVPHYVTLSTLLGPDILTLKPCTSGIPNSAARLLAI